VKQVLEAIDAELAGIDEEVEALEREVGAKRGRKDQLHGLRRQAEAMVDGERPGPEEASDEQLAEARKAAGEAARQQALATGPGTPTGSPADREALLDAGKRAGEAVGRMAKRATREARKAKVLEALEATGIPMKRGAIRQSTGGIPNSALPEIFAELLEEGKIRRIGEGSSTRYQAASTSDFEQAPAEDAAPPAPANISADLVAGNGQLTRSFEVERKPAATVAKREEARKAKANAGRLAKSEIAKALRDVLEQASQPIKGKDLNAAVAERTGAGNAAITGTRTQLCIHRQITAIERDDGTYYQAGAETTRARPTAPNGDGPRTRLEERVYDAIGAGGTAQDISRRSGVAAAAVLGAFRRRGIANCSEGRWTRAGDQEHEPTTLCPLEAAA
jgi:hypothetical protein